MSGDRDRTLKRAFSDRFTKKATDLDSDSDDDRFSQLEKRMNPTLSEQHAKTQAGFTLIQDLIRNQRSGQTGMGGQLPPHAAEVVAAAAAVAWGCCL